MLQLQCSDADTRFTRTVMAGLVPATDEFLGILFSAIMDGGVATHYFAMRSKTIEHREIFYLSLQRLIF